MSSSIVILASQMLFNVVPADDRTSFFDHHQRRVDENEDVPRDVESIPEVARFQAAPLCVISFHVASSIRVFNNVEEIRPAVPEDGGNYESRNVVLEELLDVATAQRDVGEVEERRAK